MALVAVAVALVIAYIHAQLDGSGSSYTSFCNVNDQVNCDAVLSSPFAKLLGIPVAWLGAAVYASVGIVLRLAARAIVAGGGARLLQAAAVTVAGASAFVVYMALISFGVLGTACLLCMALYILTAMLLWVVLRAPRELDRLRGDNSARTLPPWLVGGSFAAAAAAIGILALATWPGVASLPVTAVSLADVRAADPRFYDWYMSQPVVDVGDGGRTSSGDPAAPVVIVEFSDFQCAYCRRSHQRLTELLERKAGSVRVVHRHFPLDKTCNVALEKTLHSLACRAAEAAECAARQGRYDALSKLLFEHQRQLFESNLLRLADEAGLDMAEFRRCMQRGETLALIRDDTRAGGRLDIHSTPTLFINGRRVRGTFEESAGYDYAVLIEMLLEQGNRP